MKNAMIIDKEYILTEAEVILERGLSQDECDEVLEVINEKLLCIIQDSIHEVVDFNKMLKRNKNAENKLPHYKVYWRNKNAYQLEFKQMGVFKSEDDARKFIHHDIITEFDEWRIVMVNKNNSEQEVYKINEYTPDKIVEKI